MKKQWEEPEVFFLSIKETTEGDIEWPGTPGTINDSNDLV
jgi:hypothetical protein